LVRLRGKGGFGEVWEAVGPGGFPVALKFVELGSKVGESELRALEVIKGIRHAHLLATFGAWQVAGRLIIAVELADKTLFDRFQECVREGYQGIPAPELREYMWEAAKGLDYLNEPHHGWEGQDRAGIQHRDIKPQNLLLLGGTVKVADFGLARVLQGVVASHSGALTPAYAAPEFFEAHTTPWSDQYSLAVTYCQLRGGRLPFTGNPAALMAAHLNKEPDLTMLPADEQPAVARALAKNPRDRWPSCQAFVNALGNFASRDKSVPLAPGESMRAVPQASFDPVLPRASRPERFALTSLPNSLSKCVQEELAHGEEVQWAGQPSSVRFALRALPNVTAGVLAILFGVFWTVGTLEVTQKFKERDEWHASLDQERNAQTDDLRRQGPGEPGLPRMENNRPPPPSPSTLPEPFRYIFPLFGILVAVVGLGTMGPPLWMIHKARTTAYLVTNRRAIIVAGGWGTHVRSFGPPDLGHMERRRRADGSGDIILAKDARAGGSVPEWWSPKDIGFFGIPQVNYVAQLLQDLAAGREDTGGCGPEPITS
jgi:serine/threonine protein kinase